MTRPGRLADQDARDAILNDLDDTLFVEAAAGTGKTTALTGRIVEVLKHGLGTLEDIVAVTFTEKAAGEMKLRLRAAIEEARVAEENGEARERLSRALGHLELAHIGTIHGFCADLLRERPIEAGVDPAFRVAAEDEAGRLLDGAFEGWFEGALADPGPGVRRALRRHYPRNSGGPRAALRAAAGSLVDQRDFDAPWSRPEWDREAELDRALDLLRELAAFAPLASRPDDYLTQNLRHVERGVREIELREKTRGRDYDYLEAWLRPFVRARWRGWFWRGFRSRDFGRGLAKADVVARRDEVRADVEEILRTADADLAAHLRDELWPVTERYETAKRRDGCLDFVDLLIRARGLLRDNAEIRRHYRKRFTRFFVDEFQDTDPLQVEILLLLCGEDPEETRPERIVPSGGKLFVVGDPKQSIYRFRRADVMLYERTKRRLAEADARVLHLSTSFRSQPRLQAAVNGAFATRMKASEDGSQAAYVPLAPFREDAGSQPATIALPVPKPYGRFGKVRGIEIEQSLPVAIGEMVRWLVDESGWVVTERERPEDPVPVQARHICLLFRRFQKWGEDVTRPYVRALEARAIPHVLVGGRSYHDREEVLAVRNALTAIEWPDDRLAVYAALRGPLFSLGDRALFEFGVDVGPLHPLAGWEPNGGSGRKEDGTALKPELRDVATVLGLLGDLHRHRNRRPIPETVRRLLSTARAHAGIAIWPTGEQALANVLRLVDRARAFERGGSPSFRAFLDRLEDEAERGQSEEAPIVEEGTEGVRMMTVHKAKGLEFPVVILADMTCAAAHEPPSRHMDAARRLWAQRLCGATPRDILDNAEVERHREMAEADRLAYVAATRARDLLVVPALGDGRDGGGGFSGEGGEWWLESLNPAVYPPHGARRRPSSAEGLGAPAFGDESVLDRPDGKGGQRPTPRDSVAPGLHTAEAGTDIVWWDPAALDLDVGPRAGDRQRRLLEVESEEQPSLDVEAGRGAHREWQAARAARLEAGGRRTMSVTTAGAIARRAAEASDADGESRSDTRVAWVDVPRPEAEGPDGAGRPGGERFGDLVHRILAEIPLDADSGTVEGFAETLGRTLGSPETEIVAAAALAMRALEHEVFDRARAALAANPGAVHREVPVFHVADAAAPEAEQDRERGAAIVEGVADLAFREVTGSGPCWTVVDYKTDRRPAGRHTEYEVQVACYVEAIGRARREPALGIVLAL
ncbi:UvrD-helicase domain-containing protein [Candidatus Palauibacter soopunensis]|uniref:UvrD-helicase domain-containing protein n=1 Tax=Candidatus Palauibacter soopunensis TaxID=3056739 RepID=UPI00238C5807|nr:UvrD-helicase domain-containing protein [Candidatus Palauibacter soopunensis]MDE2878412.1 UvrD-helicase domain-containing protein [Candidatus Palauibacter soopunensis]